MKIITDSGFVVYEVTPKLMVELQSSFTAFHHSSVEVTDPSTPVWNRAHPWLFNYAHHNNSRNSSTLISASLKSFLNSPLPSTLCFGIVNGFLLPSDLCYIRIWLPFCLM